MIRPEGFRGAAFGSAADGNAKWDSDARFRISGKLGIPSEWAFVEQVHGAEVVTAHQPGVLGAADAIITTAADLPVGIATADCLPIVIEGPRVVAAVHGGWRGLAAGVVERTLQVLRAASLHVERAAIGPAIGACCYEVGAEVAERFPSRRAVTTWGTESIDLAAVAGDALAGLEVWQAGVCTMCGDGFNSYRRDRTPVRQVAVGWLPTG